jgi:hypothetical protein
MYEWEIEICVQLLHEPSRVDLLLCPIDVFNQNFGLLASKG